MFYSPIKKTRKKQIYKNIIDVVMIPNKIQKTKHGYKTEIIIIANSDPVPRGKQQKIFKLSI